MYNQRMTRNYNPRSLALVALVACGLVWSGHLAAQMPTDAPEQAEDQPTFRVAVDLVTTDIIARDSNGLFVTDLDKDEFVVLEDGVRQELSSMVLVHGGRAYNQLLPPPPPAEEGIILPPPRAQTDTAGRIFMIFIDDLHLDVHNTPRIRALFKRISSTLIHEGDMFSMVSTGPSSIEVGLTYDRELLNANISRIRGFALTPQDIIQRPQGLNGPTEVRWRAQVAFSTAREVLRHLEDIKNRRKAVIYVSNGYDLDPFPEGRLGTDPLFGSQNPYAEPDRLRYQQRGSQNQFADADMQVELAELTRAANRANATLYSIDPRGLVGGVDIDQPVNPAEFFDYIRKSQDTLRVLAEETGGIAVVNQNNFDKALKRIDAETSDYYVIGYYSNNPDPRRRTRELKVETTREGVDVWSRTSYTMRTLGKDGR